MSRSGCSGYSARTTKVFLLFLFCVTRNATDNDDVKSELKNVHLNGRAESVLLLEVQHRAWQCIDAQWVLLSMAGVTEEICIVSWQPDCVEGEILDLPFACLHIGKSHQLLTYTDASVVTTATHADGLVMCRHTNLIRPLANNHAYDLSVKIWFEKQMICLQS